MKPDHDPYDRPDNSANHQARPYWKRAHHSFIFWIAVFLMLAAMIFYVATGGLAGWNHGKTRQPISVPVVN